MSSWRQDDVEKGGPEVQHQTGLGPTENSNATTPASLHPVATNTTTPSPQNSLKTSKKKIAQRLYVHLKSFAHSPALRLSYVPAIRRRAVRARQINADIIVHKIHEQRRGYPKLATFLDSDDVFMIYRRFGYIQSRLILEKQDDLAKLELELEALEENQFKENVESLMTRRDPHEDRAAVKLKIMRDLEKTWNEYCILVTNASKMVSMNKPSITEHRSVTQFMINTKPLIEPEDHFIHHRDDLITLRPGREHAWLDAGVENILNWSRSKWIKGLFQSEDTVAKSDGSDGITLYTRSRIEKCVIGIITITILVLIIVPVYLLYNLTLHGSTNPASIGVLVVATLACSACTSLFTHAKRYEILMASAAYCAVLVVFIGNINDRSGPDPTPR